jgi:hypothetical protein
MTASKVTFRQLEKFQVVATRFRLILGDNRRVGVDFKVAFDRALGSLNDGERRKWRRLFLEYRDDWEDAYLRRSMTELVEDLHAAGMLRR